MPNVGQQRSQVKNMLEMLFSLLAYFYILNVLRFIS